MAVLLGRLLNTLTVTTYEWDNSATPPSYRAAVTYEYETKGGYTVQMTVTYDGGFTVTGPYGVAVGANIGAITVSSSRAYDVIEVRSALD